MHYVHVFKQPQFIIKGFSYLCINWQLKLIACFVHAKKNKASLTLYFYYLAKSQGNVYNVYIGTKRH